MHFISKKFHAFIDYPVALGLIAFPTLLGLGTTNPAAFWLSVITGFAALTLTAFTNHETGLFKVLPYKFHLLVDGMVGGAFVLAPFILNLSGIDALYYWVIGGTVLAVVGMHKEDVQMVPAE